MPMLIIRVERDTVPSRTKRVKLRTSKPSVTEIHTGTMEQEGKEATHTHQEQPRRATNGAKKQEV